MLGGRGRADPDDPGQLGGAARGGQRPQHRRPGRAEQRRQAVAVGRVGRQAVADGRAAAETARAGGVDEDVRAEPAAEAEQGLAGPERRRHQHHALAVQIPLAVEAGPVEPVVPPAQPRVQRAEQLLEAAGRERRHPPGHLGVERDHGAVPARLDDRVMQIVQRPDDELDRLPVTVGQVPDPGRRTAGPVSPVVPELRAQHRAGGGAHLLEPFLEVGRDRVEEVGPRQARPEQVEQRARGGRERRLRRAQPPVSPAVAGGGRQSPQLRHGQHRLEDGRGGRAEPGAGDVVGGEVEPRHRRLLSSPRSAAGRASCGRGRSASAVRRGRP